MPWRGALVAAFWNAALTASAVVGRLNSTVMSVMELFATGMRTANPFSLPLSSGMTSPMAFAEPVEVGKKLSNAQEDGGCDRTWEVMDKDPFFVSKNLYAVLHGCNSTATPLGDIWRLMDKWEHDCGDYKGPCFVYNGDPETVLVSNAEQNHRAIPQSELVIMKGHGHTTIMLEAPTIIKALLEGKSAEQVY